MAGSKLGPKARRGMTKAGLVDAVYERHGGLTKSEAAEVVDTIFKTVKSTLVDGRPVKITNFGVFEVVKRPERAGVNPVSGERIRIPTQKGLNFRPSDRLKQVVKDPEGPGGAGRDTDDRRTDS